MTFPLKLTDRPSSLLSNLPIGCSRLTERPRLAPIFFAFEALAHQTGMSPGSPEELDQAFHVICRGSISHQDDQIRQSFARFLESQHKNAKKPLALNLEEALGSLTRKELPPYEHLMRAAIICFQITGLTGDREEWMRILRRFYCAEMDANTHLLGDLCSYLHNNHLNQQSPQQEKQHIDEVKKSSKLQVQFLSDVLNCSLKNRLQFVLEPSIPLSDESRAEKLQNTCNLLLRENYLLKKIAELFEHLQFELLTEEGGVLKLGQIAKVLRSMSKSSEGPVEKNFTSVSFSLVVSDLINKIYLHRKRMPKFLKCESELLNSLNSHHFFTRFDRVFRYVDEIEKTHGKFTKKDELSKTAVKIKNELKTIKCVFHCDNTLVYCLDVHLRVFKNLAIAPPKDWGCISPIFEALFRFFQVNNNLEKGESDQFEMIDFFSKIITLYLDHQKKQGLVYKKAHSQLCELIDRQSSRDRRHFLKYKKIDVELPGFQQTLPDKLDPFSIKSFLDPKKAKGKEKGEIEADADVSDRQKAPSSQKTSDFLTKKGVSQSDHPSSSRPVEKEPAPLSPSPKETRTQKDRVETLRLLDLPNATPFPFTYDRRVTRWFSASVPLDSNLFPQYSGTPQYQNTMIDLHAFSQLADYFCGKSYQYDPPQNLKETKRHILPAELSWGHSPIRGYILWAIDGENCCYHRFFHIDESPSYYDKLVRRAFQEADFPELSRARQEKLKKLAHLDQNPSGNAGKVEIEFDELLQILSIRELDKNRTLRIFIGKSNSEEEGSS